MAFFGPPPSASGAPASDPILGAEQRFKCSVCTANLTSSTYKTAQDPILLARVNDGARMCSAHYKQNLNLQKVRAASAAICGALIKAACFVCRNTAPVV